MLDKAPEHLINLNKENQTTEIKRRFRLGWTTFSNLSYFLQTKIYSQCVRTLSSANKAPQEEESSFICPIFFRNHISKSFLY